MNANEWSAAFGELARQTMSSPELERYFSIPITKARARRLFCNSFRFTCATGAIVGLLSRATRRSYQ